MILTSKYTHQGIWENIVRYTITPLEFFEDTEPEQPLSSNITKEIISYYPEGNFTRLIKSTVDNRAQGDKGEGGGVIPQTQQGL